MNSVRFIILITLLLLSGCTSNTPPTPDDDQFFNTRDFSIHELLNDQPNPGCKAMFDGYCGALYSPGSDGNLRIHTGKETLEILQGKTANDLPAAFYNYSKAKIRNKQLLPHDFQQTLDDSAYFSKLDSYLSQPQPESMSLDRKIQAIRNNMNLGGLWDAAIAATVLRRMEHHYPGYHKLREDMVPIELQLERKRERRRLISDISKSNWSKDPKWVNVEASFEKLRTHFYLVIDRLKIDPEIKKQWKDKISKIELVIPGAVPEISDTECSTTQANAFYYNHLNLLTVCAGDFNSEDILETLAHEMSHSLDFERSSYLFQINSKVGKSITSLRHEVCAEQVFSCATWDNFKAHLDTNLSSLKQFKVDLPEFQRCLKRRPTVKELEEDDLDRLAEQKITDSIAELATSEIFLRITKEKIPLPNGKLGKNPNYLNPCDYYLWSKGEEPIDDELNGLIFFTAEYRCSQGDPAARLKNAINQSKKISYKIAKEVLRSEGEFSDEYAMESEGFSASPVERFADVVGSYALADLLGSYPRQLDRRNVFLASSSWLCSKPSLASLYPDEETIQQEFSFDAHTGSDERKKEFFSAPVRNTLGCKKDFQFNECTLPF